MDEKTLRIHLALIEKYGAAIDQMTMEELSILSRMVSDRYKQLEGAMYERARSTFHPGHHVSWEHDGVKYLGKVQKINKKTIQVIELAPPHRKWNIYPDFLTVVPKGQK